MPFVKIDCQMLESTTWADFPARNVFIAALLMAEPFELREETHQICVRSLDNTEFIVPPGWYGLVNASGPGIVYRAKIAMEKGMKALERLGNPDISSRSQTFEGRRMVRIDGGYLILNYDRFRHRDYSAPERNRRYRAKIAAQNALQRNERPVTRNGTSRDVSETQAEAYIRSNTAYTVSLNSTHDYKNYYNKSGAARKKLAPAFDLPEYIDSEIWEEFLKIRKQKKAINSIRAFKLLLTELEKLKAQGEDPNACMEQSIVNSWKDVYPKHAKEGNNRNGRKAKLSTEEFLRISRRSPDFGSGAVPHEKPVGD
jgi:hypothetical protein